MCLLNLSDLIGVPGAVLSHAGKLLQEQVLCRDAARRPKLAIRLLYLPVVLGEGGSWSRVLQQAKRSGVALPPLMSAQARVNHIEVGDVARHLLETRGDAAPGIRRAILNRTESATLTKPSCAMGASKSRSRCTSADFVTMPTGCRNS